MARRRRRDLAACVKAGVWPDVDPDTTLIANRIAAIEEVLCCLPETSWSQLVQPARQFVWFLPCPLVLGQVMAESTANGPVSCRVIYLSPLLEQQPLAWSVTTAAHELAHVVLRHRLGRLALEINARQEKEAQEALEEWGFLPESRQMLQQVSTATATA